MGTSYSSVELSVVIGVAAAFFFWEAFRVGVRGQHPEFAIQFWNGGKIALNAALPLHALGLGQFRFRRPESAGLPGDVGEPKPSIPKDAAGGTGKNIQKTLSSESITNSLFPGVQQSP
jgi:hypothetical protein